MSDYIEITETRTIVEISEESAIIEVHDSINIYGEGSVNYIHPANHPASIITQDSSNRFVSDTEKSTWNGKLNATNPVISGSITEGVYALSGTTPALNPANGTVQTWTLSGNSTPTNGLTATGQSMTLMVDDGSSYTITWPTMTWVGGSAPTLATTGYNVIELWRVGTVLYGAYLGAA